MTRNLDVDVLARVRRLELQARAVVEGYLSGMHRSPRHGFAVEFAQHREYAPGDDIKHIDWKVYARSERYYLKQYELETNLVGYLVVDRSESMAYGTGDWNKYDTACIAALALGYLLVQQGDSVGLALFDDALRQVLRPAGQPTQLKEIARLMGDLPGRDKTRTGTILHDLAERLTRQGIVMLFTDAFDEVDELLVGLKHLRHARHEVVVFHVMDADELDFPFQQSTLFRGLEAEADVLTDPRGVRDAYLAEVMAFQTALRKGCRNLGCEYVLLRTDADIGRELANYLSQRAQR